MDKTQSYNLIRNIVERRQAGKVEAHSSEVEEERKLAMSNDSDNSILDEEEKGVFVSPALVAKLDAPRFKREEESEILLSKREIKLLSQELGRPVSFLGVKASQEKEEEVKINLTDSEVSDLLAWAEKQ